MVTQVRKSAKSTNEHLGRSRGRAECEHPRVGDGLTPHVFALRPPLIFRLAEALERLVVGVVAEERVPIVSGRGGNCSAVSEHVRVGGQGTRSRPS